MKPVVYAMAGPIGSGKTTWAKRIAAEKHAAFFSIDQFIKMLGQPIHTAQDYDRFYLGMRGVIASAALQFLNRGISVVLDFGGTRGHWDWLRSLAESANADVEIHRLNIPLEIRRERVKARNSDPDAVFQFSDEEFDSMPKDSTTPEARPGLRIIEVTHTS